MSVAVSAAGYAGEVATQPCTVVSTADGAEPFIAVAAGALAWWPLFGAMQHPIFGVAIAIWMAARARKRAGHSVGPWLVILYFAACLGCLALTAETTLGELASLPVLFGIAFAGGRLFLGSPPTAAYLGWGQALLLGCLGAMAATGLGLIDHAIGWIGVVASAGVALSLATTPRHFVRESPSIESILAVGLGGAASIFYYTRTPAPMLAYASIVASICASVALVLRARALRSAMAARVVAPGELLTVEHATLGEIRVPTPHGAHLAVGESVTLVAPRRVDQDGGPFRGVPRYEAEVWQIDRTDAIAVASTRALMWAGWAVITAIVCVASLIVAP